MSIIERELAFPDPDPSEAPADRDRPYWLDRDVRAGGTGAPHLHREPDAVQPDQDRFWACQRKGCRKRPVYVLAAAVSEAGPSGNDADAWREAVAAKHRSERPRRVANEAWSAYAARWTFLYDKSPASVEARRKAEADELAAAERRRAEAAATRAAAEAWVCPEHPDGLPFASDWSGTWTARCGTGDCERGWPPAPTEDPRTLLAEDPDGWQCPRHGLDAITRLRWDRDRIVRSCTWCPEMDHGSGQPVKPVVAELEAYFARNETDAVRQRRDEEEVRRVEAERVAALPRCASCGRDVEAHDRTPTDHEFDASPYTYAKDALAQILVIAGVLSALCLFVVSATTPGAPFHDLTGHLLCTIHVQGAACG
jgi:hypothetical protein